MQISQQIGQQIGHFRSASLCWLDRLFGAPAGRVRLSEAERDFFETVYDPALDGDGQDTQPGLQTLPALQLQPIQAQLQPPPNRPPKPLPKPPPQQPASR